MIKMSGLALTFAVAFAGLPLLISCNKDDDKTSGVSANLPHLTPTVKAAAPAGLQAGLVGTAVQGLSDRFFNADGGPSNIFNLLANIDKTVDNINVITAGDEKACRSQEPVAYTINPAGLGLVTMYGQCYQVLAAGAVSTTAGLQQYGIKDGVIYLYSYAANGESAAIVTPLAGSEGKYTVKAWFSLSTGTGATWDVGSYGLMNLYANSETKAFEFTVGGIALGYCGAQLKSDGTDIFASTSIDMGSTCNAVEDVCASAANLGDSTSCSAAIKIFDLFPIGRRSATGSNVSGTSKYPLLPNLDFDGTATDDIHFGPTTPIAGLGSL